MKKILYVTLFLATQVCAQTNSEPSLRPQTIKAFLRNETPLPVGSSEEDEINNRYEKGKTALTQIKSGIANVNEVLLFVQLEQSLELGTTLWADEDFRNGFDKINDIGSSIGLIIAAGSMAISDENEDSQDISLVGGLGLAGISKIFGLLFGSQKGSKFERKIQFIELSRSAYDDLGERFRIIEVYTKHNDQLQTNLDAFLSENYIPAGGKDGSLEKRKEALLGAISYVNQYEAILGQIPSLLGVYESAIEKYCPGILDASAGEYPDYPCKISFNTDSYTLDNEISTHIKNAAKKLKKLQEQAQLANEIRVVSPELRSAFQKI